MRERDRGPASEFARYAYGYSDKPPGAAWWVIVAVMIGVVVAHMVSIR